jgi:HAD superfamily 5'-nucleotidase-like hydrolase
MTKYLLVGLLLVISRSSTSFYRSSSTLRPAAVRLSPSQLRGTAGSDDNSETSSSSTRIPCDESWQRDANAIEYLSDTESTGVSFYESFGREIGLNISSELKRRRIIPRHLTSDNDLFCNRELNMKQIKSIGFDMDWTLAQYNRDFDNLAYNGAISKLVNDMGYPREECEALKYQLNICRRGCIIDSDKGNILKLDKTRYLRRVEHGLTAMTKEDIKNVFKDAGRADAESYTGPNFINIDTPFSLVDACLYAQLVDLRDQFANSENETQTSTIAMKSYSELWKDIRKAVDRCHKDGAIKLEVAKNPSKYIEYDPNIFPMLDSFRKSGLKVFLLTNSDFAYTQVVMNYLFDAGKKQRGAELTLDWAEFFDLVIVAGE